MAAVGEEHGTGGQEQRYRRLGRTLFLSMTAVSLGPLLVAAILGYHQYEKAYRAELFEPIASLTSITRQSVEFFLEERRAALAMVVNVQRPEELEDQAGLEANFRNLSGAFGGFADLGFIDESGRQRTYAGPFPLVGREYRDQPWFTEVRQEGVHVSSVFLGYRGVPHFVIAVRHERPGGGWYVLRATIDSEVLYRRVRGSGVPESCDAFLVTRDGLLQSPSRLFGGVLERLPPSLEVAATGSGVFETEDSGGDLLVVGRSPVGDSPFGCVLVSRPRDQVANWRAVRRELLIFFAVSGVLILTVIGWGSGYMVRRIRDADRQRESVLHKVEYTNRMATLGRLAAGVAHEVNNPLAIINEKAGLLQDLLARDPAPAGREKLLELARSVTSSVERASRVTHRLLGFARHVDVRTEEIRLGDLIQEVIGFLGREASYRNVRLSVREEEGLPAVESDRGQLQQVFLNILNNALAAVRDDTGRIDIDLAREGPDSVRVSVTDNGVGIEKGDMTRIFEPFFTTRQGYGTGLGLSVTYGIVQKLGGTLGVDSELGAWTTFTVTLPLRGKASQGEEDGREPRSDRG